MAFDLDMADYPDNTAFWAASAPDYLTNFQPEEMRLLTTLFPDSAHVDQYVGKAVLIMSLWFCFMWASASPDPSSSYFDAVSGCGWHLLHK